METPGTASDVAVANGYAYVAEGTSVQVVSVATPSQAAIVGSLATSASAVALAGSRLYAVDGLQSKIIDVTTPAAPALLSATTGYGVQGIAAAGTVVYLATPALNHGDPSGGVRALDVSSPTAPRLIEQLVVPGLTPDAGARRHLRLRQRREQHRRRHRRRTVASNREALSPGGALLRRG